MIEIIVLLVVASVVCFFFPAPGLFALVGALVGGIPGAVVGLVVGIIVAAGIKAK